MITTFGGEPDLDSWCTPDDFEWSAPAPYVHPDVVAADKPRCDHCGGEPKSQRGAGLGSWCIDYRRRHDGHLPSAEAIEEHERRAWAKLSPTYMAGSKHRRTPRHAALLEHGETYDSEYGLQTSQASEYPIDPQTIVNSV